MSTVNDGPTSGQDTTISAEIPERAARDADELIALLERHAKAIIRCWAKLTSNTAELLG